MVTCGPIVFPKALWIHLQINFDFNVFHLVQIFQSMLMVINWYKTAIARYIFFSYLLPGRKKNMNKRHSVGKGIRRNSHAVWKQTAPPTQHGQNHHTIKVLWYITYITDYNFYIRYLKDNHFYTDISNIFRVTKLVAWKSNRHMLELIYSDNWKNTNTSKPDLRKGIYYLAEGPNDSILNWSNCAASL